jgi:hypothetical protein
VKAQYSSSCGGEAERHSFRAPSGCTDRTHPVLDAGGKQRHRAGLPQARRGEVRQYLGVVPRRVRPGSDVGVDAGGCSAALSGRARCACRPPLIGPPARSRRLPQPRQGRTLRPVTHGAWRPATPPLALMANSRSTDATRAETCTVLAPRSRRTSARRLAGVRGVRRALGMRRRSADRCDACGD